MLRDWKQSQLDEFDQVHESWSVTDDEAAEIADASFVIAPINLSDSAISLGGEAARAPCAGGGGGGAIGPGAAGGAGGEGAEVATGLFGIQDLPDSIEVIVGRGGRGGSDSGDGEEGEETAFGDLLRAKGGTGGLAGQRSAAVGSDAGRERVRISSAFLVNYTEVRDGLLNTLGAAWANYSVPGLPHSMNGQLVFVVEVDAHDPIALDLRFDILDPTSKVVFTSPIELRVDCTDEIVRVIRAPYFQVEVRETGVWQARVSFDENELSRVAFEVRRS